MLSDDDVKWAEPQITTTRRTTNRGDESLGLMILYCGIFAASFLTMNLDTAGAILGFFLLAFVVLIDVSIGEAGTQNNLKKMMIVISIGLMYLGAVLCSSAPTWMFVIPFSVMVYFSTFKATKPFR